MESKIKSARLGVGDLFSIGWQLYRTHFATILCIVLCVYIPVNLITPLLPVDWQLLGGDGKPGLQLSIQLAQPFEFLISTLAMMGIAVTVELAVQGEALAWYAVLRYSLAKWLTAIGTGLLAVLVIMGLALLLIIPGLIWAFYYAFVIYAVALRNVSGRAALAYSKRLVEGQWWRVFGLFLLLDLIERLLGSGITSLMKLIAGDLLWHIITKTTTDVISAFATVVMVLLFLNSDYVKTAPEAILVDN